MARVGGLKLSMRLTKSRIEKLQLFNANTGIAFQMMFVSGETAEPSIETTTLIEEIVRQQVIEIVGTPLFILILLLN